MEPYKVFDRFAVLKSAYGSADPEKLADLSAGRLEQEIFESDPQKQIAFIDGASSYITLANMQNRLTRDLMLDQRNPRQILPQQSTDKIIDTIPNLNPVQPDLSTPADYEFSTTAEMYRSAQRHYKKEDNLFIKRKGKGIGGGGGGGGGDGKSTQDGKTKTTADSGTVTPQQSLDQMDLFEGGAAGRPSNRLQLERLGKDSEDNSLNSVESINAF